MAAQEQSLLNVQTNLSNTSINVEKNLIKVVKNMESNILNKLKNENQLYYDSAITEDYFRNVIAKEAYESGYYVSDPRWFVYVDYKEEILSYSAEEIPNNVWYKVDEESGLSHGEYAVFLFSKNDIINLTWRLSEKTNKQIGVTWEFNPKFSREQVLEIINKDPLIKKNFFNVYLFKHEPIMRNHVFHQRRLKDIYYGQFVSYEIDPMKGIFAIEYTDINETDTYSKQLTVANPATVVLHKSGELCYCFKTDATFEKRPAFTEGSPTKNIAALPQLLAAKVVQDQLGLDGFIFTHNNGSLVENYLEWNIVIDGPNKNLAYYIFELDLSNEKFKNDDGLVLLSSAGMTLEEFYVHPLVKKIEEGTATLKEKETVAKLIDWSKPVPDYWAFLIVFIDYFIEGGNTVNKKSKYLYEVVVLPIQLHDKYEDDPEYSSM